MEKLLCKLINTTLTGKPLELGEVTEEEWQQCFDMALQQNVLAMTFPAMSSLPKELRPSFTLWSKWMAYTQSVAEQSQYKRQVVEKIGSCLAGDGLTTTLIKGFSLSALYPNPNLREFSDIDIFSGENYNAVNTCFSKHGVKVDSVDGHHAYLKVDGISVEHHFAFSNTKVKDGLVGPEDALRGLAVTNPKPTSIPGINFPNPAFTTLFVGWHAYEHFLQEKIELRHVIDWVMAIHQLFEDEEAELVNEVKSKTKWGKFDDTLTAIAIHQLGIPQDWFSATEIEAANSIDEVQEQRVWNDILNSPHTAKSKNSNKRRLYIAKRMLRNSWKYKTYSNLSASQLVLKETIGHCLTKSKSVNSKL